MIRVGIGGWTFEPWRGVFYPAGLPQARELEYAASQMTAIEVNGTYYSGFKPETFRKWADAAPDGFVYTVKASRFATNRKRLSEGAESVDRFLGQGITELGDKLGPILWQFMPTKTFDREDFGAFLKLLPAKRDGVVLRHALEVRHASFEDPAFIDLARDAGAAIVFSDKPGFPSIDAATADFTYARLQDAQEEIETGYTPAALADWTERAQTWSAGGRDVFMFMINGAKVRAPAAAKALIARLA
ncbi:DUF72 domain-containing protein [Sphingobium boeckii]|uniref:Uncharacterized protein YecE (DUF72 family) n=1 Tax=Sphingobium boeckii TaxID=1082345 RepID=A0A7W9ECT5_9SPHN|nr:DUF72 domain-containing protein [Sphingobium boeckii]MBB5684229.1 uncharacterized protein YecE (DUF72 family) [Sphingobium boeckii]